MSILIIHAGLGKTGTSSIQKSLERVPETSKGSPSNVCYPRSSSGRGLLSEEIFRSLLSENHAELTLAVEILREKSLQEDYVIISGEIMGHSNSIAKVRFFDVMLDIFDAIHIIVYVREPYKWNSAAAAQLLIDGVDIGALEKWPYLETQTGLLRVFFEYSRFSDRIHLEVHQFEEAKEHLGGLPSHFLSRCSLISGNPIHILSDTHYLNKSLDAYQYITIGCSNRFFRDNFDERKEFIDRVRNMIPQKYAPQFSQFYALDDVETTTAADRVLLRRNFGIEYSVRETLTSTDSHMDKLRNFYKKIAKAESPKQALSCLQDSTDSAFPYS